GSWQRAIAAATEALALAREVNQPLQVVDVLCDLTRIEAARGDVQACRAHAAEATTLAERHGQTIVLEQIRTSLGLLELGLGRPEDALRHLEDAARGVAELDFYDRDVSPEPDLVEALVRLGRTDGVLDAIARVEHTGAAWGKAVAARMRGVFAD